MAPRKTTLPACLDEYQGSVRMLQDAESELTVDIGQDWNPSLLRRVNDRVAHAVDRMMRTGAKALRGLYLIGSHQSNVPMEDVLCNLPPVARDTLHTVCVSHSNPRPGFVELKGSPFLFGLHLPNVTTVKLTCIIVDVSQLKDAFPNIRSLQMSNCTHTGISPLLLTGLCDFRFKQQEGSQHLCQELMGFLRHAPSLTSVHLHLSSQNFSSGDTCSFLSKNAAIHALRSLTLHVNVTGSIETELDHFQEALDELARRCPGLLHLALITPLSINIPEHWSHLIGVRVGHKTVVPPLLSITSLTIENLSSADVSRQYAQTGPLPPGLKSLSVSYNALLCATGCNSLEQLSVIPYVRDETFHLSDHVSLLMAVATGAVWPKLDRLLILQEMLPYHQDNLCQREKKYIYTAQLLETLASVPGGCPITHVTLRQGKFGTGGSEALRKMPLRSLTLIGMEVSYMQLKDLMDWTGNLELLELIGVKGLSEKSKTSLAKYVREKCEWRRARGEPILTLCTMEKGDVDTVASSSFEWSE